MKSPVITTLILIYGIMLYWRITDIEILEQLFLGPRKAFPSFVFVIWSK